MIRWMKPALASALVAVVAAACSDTPQAITAPRSVAPPTVAQNLVSALNSTTTLTPPGPAGASYVLYAGQDTPVGTIEVTNGEGQLKVQYVAYDGYCFTEVHLQPFTDDMWFGDVPQKNGNPQPGRFAVNEEYAPDCLSETQVFGFDLLGLGGGMDDIHIAAHAKVAMPVEGSWEQVWQIGDVEEPVLYPDGNEYLSNYADEFNWGAPADATTAGPGLNVAQPPFADPFIVGTTPTDEFPYNSNFNRGYATDFDVQWFGALWFGGRLTVSWSPGQSAAEKKVLSDGGVSATFTATGTPEPGQGWFLDTYPLVQDQADVEALTHGTHTINFQHTKGDGTFWDWVRLEQPKIEYESAWAGVEDPGAECEDDGDRNDIGCDFPGKNWATYVTYTPVAYCPALGLTNIQVLDVDAADGKDLSQNGPNESEYPLIFFETLHEGESFYYYADFDESAAGEKLWIVENQPVCAYYVAYDPPTSAGTVEGSITLPGDVFVGMAGVKDKDPNNYLDDILSDGSFDFPLYGGRWLEELADANNDNLVAVNNELEIRVKVGGGNVDHFRFFTDLVY